MCYTITFYYYRKEFNIDVLKKFIDLHDFTGKSLVNALRYAHVHVYDMLVLTQGLFCYCRRFLASFHLPGEAQKIDRIMELFAQKFISCNPEGYVTNPG